jgi:hypothetical protein
MKHLAIFLVLAVTFNGSASELKSEAIKTAIAQELEIFEDQWTDNEGLSIWISSEDINFEISQWISKNHMKVQVDFICGSELDSSEFSGSCEVDVLKDEKSSKWIAVIENSNKCSCEVAH